MEVKYLVYCKDFGLLLKINFTRSLTVGTSYPSTTKYPFLEVGPDHFSRDVYLPPLPTRCDTYRDYGDLTRECVSILPCKIQCV